MLAMQFIVLSYVAFARMTWAYKNVSAPGELVLCPQQLCCILHITVGENSRYYRSTSASRLLYQAVILVQQQFVIQL